MKYIILFFVFYSFSVFSQKPGYLLTVDKIMQDPKWIGSSPSGLQWDKNSYTLYFRWNPDQSVADSLYKLDLHDSLLSPVKVPMAEQYQFLTNNTLTYNLDKSMWTYEKNGNIYFQSNQNSFPIQVTNTLDREDDPVFSFQETAITYEKGDNLFAWNISDGTTTQLTNFTKESPPKTATTNIQESWLKQDQLQELMVLAKRKHKKDLSDSLSKIYTNIYMGKPLKPIYTEDKILRNKQICPEGRFITYTLSTPFRDKSTIVPNYVTESGYTTTLPARPKVGVKEGYQDLFILDKLKDTIYKIDTKGLEGIRNIPEFFKDYPEQYNKMKKDSAVKGVTFSPIVYAPFTGNGLIDIRSIDHKDRWICIINFEQHLLKLIDHQHDEAWIAGPGIGNSFSGNHFGWLDRDKVWYQSERTGYSHLYIYSISENTNKALTQGNYEVINAKLSNNKKSFYITTNEVHPGEQHYYQLSITGGKATKITAMEGSDSVVLSPNEEYLGFLHSTSNHPWELYIQENKPGSKPIAITNKAMSVEFKAYPWRKPEVITFNAADQSKVYARIYKPDKKIANKAAVIFVHGAGYLQNAHKWWSSYFREYMFNNLLTDLGYTVMDIDYRGSAGYGRDWRTGIYRHMGGKDLSDHIDAAHFLSSTLGIDPGKIGIYGGSYGGFITLMGLFTAPEVFGAGAALRPVTDWAQYNHPYTSNILNDPFTDSIAYRKSSPWYFAEGLKKPLLICHGMIDINVHYQDAIKLIQRLIELKKDNWELASYPMEDHGFVDPSSWADEYKRILKLFESNLHTNPKTKTR